MPCRAGADSEDFLESNRSMTQPEPQCQAKTARTGLTLSTVGQYRKAKLWEVPTLRPAGVARIAPS